MDASDGRREGNVKEVKCLNEACFPQEVVFFCGHFQIHYGALLKETSYKSTNEE